MFLAFVILATAEVGPGGRFFGTCYVRFSDMGPWVSLCSEGTRGMTWRYG